MSMKEGGWSSPCMGLNIQPFQIMHILLQGRSKFESWKEKDSFLLGAFFSSVSPSYINVSDGGQGRYRIQTWPLKVQCIKIE